MWKIRHTYIMSFAISEFTIQEIRSKLPTTTSNDRVNILHSLLPASHDAFTVSSSETERIADAILPVLLSEDEKVICEDLIDTIEKICSDVDKSLISPNALILISLSIIGTLERCRVLHRCMENIYFVLGIYNELLTRNYSVANQFYARVVLLNPEHIEYLCDVNIPFNSDILHVMSPNNLQLLGSHVNGVHKSFQMVLEVCVTEIEIAKQLLINGSEDLLTEFRDVCIKSKRPHLITLVSSCLNE